MKIPIRLTNKELYALVSESVQHVLSESKYDYSLENGVNLKWLRKNQYRYKNYKDEDEESHRGNSRAIRDEIENDALNNEKLAMYFSEPSNDIQELRYMLSDYLETKLADLPPDNLESYNIITGYFNEWLNDVMWKMREKYQGAKRPTVRDNVNFLKKNFDDFDNSYFLDDKTKKDIVDRILDYVRDNDPHLYSDWNPDMSKHDRFLSARERYDGIW